MHLTSHRKISILEFILSKYPLNEPWHLSEFKLVIDEWTSLNLHNTIYIRSALGWTNYLLQGKLFLHLNLKFHNLHVLLDWIVSVKTKNLTDNIINNH